MLHDDVTMAHVLHALLTVLVWYLVVQVMRRVMLHLMESLRLLQWIGVEVVAALIMRMKAVGVSYYLLVHHHCHVARYQHDSIPPVLMVIVTLVEVAELQHDDD
jgi:hypothetical protein